MPSGLGGGYVEVSSGHSVTVSGKIKLTRLRNEGNALFNEPLGGRSTIARIGIGDGIYWEIYDDQITPGGAPTDLTISADLNRPGFGVTTIALTSVPLTYYPPGDPSPPYAPRVEFTGADETAEFSFAATVSGLRLGLLVAAIAGHETDAPLRRAHTKATYHWFTDADTEVSTTLEGNTYTWNPWSDPPSDEGSLFGNLLFGFYRFNARTGNVYVEFSDLVMAGEALDCTGLSTDDGTGRLEGTGSGTAHGTATGNGDTGYPVDGAQPPYLLEYDLDVRKATGGATTGAEVDSANLGGITMPYSGSSVFPNADWLTPVLTPETLVVNAAWAAGQAVPWDAQDLIVLLWLNAPGLGTSPAASWNALTVELADTLQLAGPEFLIVTEVPTTWALALGAEGTDLPAWRQWLGVGTLGKLDPLFNSDLAGKTKSGGVPWDWSSYSYLWLQANGPDVVTLTIQIIGVYVTASDSHVTGSQRNDDFEVTETPFEAVYEVEITDPTETAADYFIDLLFPVSASVDGAAVDLTESAPFYLGRVDRVEITGWTVGTWQLKTLKLASLISPGSIDFPGEARVKLDFGAPVQRGDYDAWHAAHNGAACCANLADRTNCTELFSVDGRGVRAFTILTGAISGVIQDAPLSLQAFADLINLLEGWTVTYETANAAAALEDAYGASVTAVAEDLEPQLPGKSLTAGTPGTLAARLMVGELQPANGVPFAVYTRAILGHGALEAVANEGGQRGGAGTTLTDGTRTGATDAHGYAEIGSVPANGLVVYTVAEA